MFTAALGAVEANYVDAVDSERLVYTAIGGMLQTLDPHSNFMDPRTYAQMRERQEGRYYGLGITIAVVDGDITVVSLFEGSPAYQKGLRRGDVIAAGQQHAIGAAHGFRKHSAIGARRRGHGNAAHAEQGVVVTPRKAGGNIAELDSFFELVQREALNYFNDGSVFLERFADKPHHIEVQIIADQHGKELGLLDMELAKLAAALKVRPS